MNRKNSYDYIRVLACICVIGIHSTGRSSYDFNESSEIIDYLIRSFCQIGLPVFFLLSGALLLNSKQTVRISEFYWKRFVKIVVPFVIYSLFYVLWVNPEYHPSDCFKIETWREVIKGIFPGIRATMETYQVVPLWFMYTSIGIYLVAPFIKIMLQNMNEATVRTLGIFLIVMRCIKNYFPVLFGFEIGVDYIFSGWILYFILGYIVVQPFMEQYYKWIEISGVAAFLLSVLICAYFPQYVSENYYDLAPHMILQALSMFVFIYRRENVICANDRITRIVQVLSKYTFSIYLLHSFVMREIVRSGILDRITSNVIINELLRIIAVFSGSFIIGVIVDNSVVKFVQYICEKIIKIFNNKLLKKREREHI